MKRRRQRGISLLEVLAAMTLFAIVASGTGALATQSIRRTAQNRHATAAVLLAQQELERLRGLPYANITPGVSSAAMGGQTFTVTTAVQADTPAANMSLITVRVSWTGAEGARSYAVQTIYTAVTT